MVKDTKLYDILGILPESTQVEIKKAYKINALKFHPDKNNHSQKSTEKFQEITKAYEILSDDSKRQIYDQNGGLDELDDQSNNQNGFNNQSGNSTQPFSMRADNLFNQFFGDSFFSSSSFGSSFSNQTHQQFSSSSSQSFNTNGFQRQPSQQTNRPKRRGPDIKHKLSVSLEEIYHGKSTKLALARTILCSSCDAKGGSKITSCNQCKGSGTIVMSKQMGPLIQRFESTCQVCRGSGNIIVELCSVCHGDKTVEERKILKLNIPPGTSNGETIVFPNEADQGIDIIPGDVLVTIEEKNHQFFKRHGEDLFTTVKIDLLTALGGGSFGIHHINNDWLKVKIVTGEIIKPNCLKQILGYGMPKKSNPNEFGVLVIQFDVEFPTSYQIDQETLPFLEKSLPPRPALSIPPDVESKEQILMDYDSSTRNHFNGANDKFNKKKRRFGDDSSSDDETDLNNGGFHMSGNNGNGNGNGNGIFGTNVNTSNGFSNGNGYGDGYGNGYGDSRGFVKEDGNCSQQ